MAFTINTNIASMQAQEYLRVNSDFQSKTINRVTSGLRIVSAGDDAAGLAIANGYRSDQAVLTQGIRNANDGMATLQTIDGGMSNIGKLLDRARNLAAQSASGTFTGDRAVLDSEFQSVMSEIDRQSQVIGLNKNGTFNKSLSVFIGGGRGASSTETLTNGSVSVDLSSSTVDTKGLGLATYRASSVSTSDIGSNSATSVSKILAQTRNGVAGATVFNFTGAGFSDSSKIALSVNTSAVTDTASLAAAINNAIATTAAGGSAAAQAFKAADISATIVTDSAGHQQLTFNSSKAGFQVAAGDQYANALMGNYRDAANGVGLASTSEITSTGAWVDPGVNQTQTIVLTNKNTGVATTSASINFSGKTNVTDVAAAINGDATLAGSITASVDNGKLVIVSDSGANYDVTVSGAGAFQNLMGAATVTTANTATLNSGGVQQSKQAQDSAAFTFVGLGAGHSQELTLGVTRNDGSLYSVSLSLTNTNAATIDNAVSALNTQMQANNDANVKGIVAVKEYLSNGHEGIRLMSTNTFTMTPGTQANSEGLRDVSGGLAYGTQLSSAASSGGGIASVGSETNAKLAVTALGEAVAALSTAQAAVGKGQNQFNYAISLASTQLTNLAASESRIRDADLAAEAANLTKAQILLQAGTAALAQANSAPQAVLSLLRG